MSVTCFSCTLPPPAGHTAHPLDLILTSGTLNITVFFFKTKLSKNGNRKKHCVKNKNNNKTNDMFTVRQNKQT